MTPQPLTIYQMCLVSRILYISCFMRLLNLLLDLLHHQMSDPKKSHGAQSGHRSYFVYQGVVLRLWSLRRHVTTCMIKLTVLVWTRYRNSNTLSITE